MIHIVPGGSLHLARHAAPFWRCGFSSHLLDRYKLKECCSFRCRNNNSTFPIRQHWFGEENLKLKVLKKICLKSKSHFSCAIQKRGRFWNSLRLCMEFIFWFLEQHLKSVFVVVDCHTVNKQMHQTNKDRGGSGDSRSGRWSEAASFCLHVNSKRHIEWKWWCGAHMHYVDLLCQYSDYQDAFVIAKEWFNRLNRPLLAWHAPRLQSHVSRLSYSLHANAERLWKCKGEPFSISGDKFPGRNCLQCQ